MSYSTFINYIKFGDFVKKTQNIYSIWLMGSQTYLLGVPGLIYEQYFCIPVMLNEDGYICLNRYARHQNS